MNPRHDRWLGRAPRERIECDGLTLRCYTPDDAAVLARAVADSFDHLRPFMAWTRHGIPTVEQERELIAEWNSGWDGLTEFTMGIFEGDALVGSTGYHLRHGVGVLEIGYWVAASRKNRGIATRVARVLVDEAFSIDGVESVVIFHDERNVASGRIPEKLGFRPVARHDRAEHPVFSQVDRAESDSSVLVEWRIGRAEWSARSA